MWNLRPLGMAVVYLFDSNVLHRAQPPTLKKRSDDMISKKSLRAAKVKPRVQVEDWIRSI